MKPSEKSQEIELYYRESLTQLSQTLIEAISASQASSGIPTTTESRLCWASIIFSKMINGVACLQKILPLSPSNPKGMQWDCSSALALARNALDSAMMLQFLCDPKMEEDEFKLRLLMTKLHDCKRRPNILQMGGHDSDVVNQYEAFKKELIDDIESNVKFMEKNPHQQKKILSGEYPYYLDKKELFEQIGFDKDKTKSIWEFFSSHSHSYATSFYSRAFNYGAGTGLEHDMDKSYCALAAEQTSMFLVSATDIIVRLFSLNNIPRVVVDWDTMDCYKVKSGYVLGMNLKEMIKVTDKKVTIDLSKKEWGAP